ncbi:hypothetical protein ACIQC8_06290 [Agrococcus sediminis]|uniref:hypothetical protein n=1 Tax=Agrococcus sediminis TaxID=2599924 RepID=UPI0037F9ED31
MTDASQSGADEVQPGGTTGAEHDGGAQQVAAESQDAIDEGLDGQSPWGADRPVSGGADDPLAGSGAPVEGAGEPREAVAADDEGDTSP